ncbi:MAG: hypothetical protein LLF97_12015 [Planctomycetaceae bacterium]|nr:hypothetical protein [Planctomycetaceae bacterium]
MGNERGVRSAFGNGKLKEGAMTTRLRIFYENLKCLSTAEQKRECEKILDALKAKSEPTLATWFCDALDTMKDFNNVDQPFLDKESTARRKPIGPDSPNTGNVIWLLCEEQKSKGGIHVSGIPEYCFQYIEREVPPMRVANGNQPKSGAGGIDYIARCGQTPILGEIKVESDGNPFYAFVQLLTYLSEMATINQVKRANKYKLFGESIGESPAFDLHMMLVDFNDRGEKGGMVKSTQELAREFKKRLQEDFPKIAGVLGRIFCLTACSKEKPLELIAKWVEE